MSEVDVAEIQIPYPEAQDLHLRIGVGACRLRIRPGDGAMWVSGSYRDPSGALPCRVFQEDGTVRITQEQNWSNILDRLGGFPAGFDLALGKAKPYALTIETGASEASLDVGSLPIRRLEIKQGAGKVALDFSAPNPVEMSLLTLSNGASGIEMRNLANANFAEMAVEGGAAAYSFDFGGELLQNGRVRVSTGVSSVEIDVPASTAAKISSETVLGGLDVGDGYMKKEGAFWTEAALAGKTPQLAIRVNVALGSLKLRTR
ncbi:MAG: hypothetical protein ACM3US_09265 [Sphingomonadaceae bacterium]